MFYFNEKAFKNNGKLILERALTRGKILMIASFAPITLAGCGPTEVSTNSHVTYDAIDTMDEEIIKNGITQVKDIREEDFKLVINYKCLLESNERWTITSTKDLYYDVRTKGLPEGYKVYIDNVHIDCSIISHYPSVDGINQDSMDDRVHTAQSLGMSISDDNAYDNIFTIEGQNQDFIQGSFYGFSGYANGEIIQERFVESDYLKHGVTGNKIKGIIDLIIIKPDGTQKYTSVGTTITVSVWPYIEHNDGTFDYYYWRNNEVEEEKISDEEYQNRVKQHTLKK